MSDIKHVNPGKRMSDAVIHNGVAYFSGKTPGDATQEMEGQTKQVLATIDALLAKVGSDKSRIFSTQFFVANISEFACMKTAWDACVAPGNPPARATIEERLASPDLSRKRVV